MIFAKYTEVLKNLLDSEQVKPLIDKALSTYPMYEPKNKSEYSYISTREELNKKILDFYKYREIGFETVGRFLDELEIAMVEIMPKYNQLYKSVDMMNDIDDIFGNVDITESFEQETSNNSSSSANSKNDTNVESNTSTDYTSNNKNVESDTPQGQLNIGSKGIDELKYGSKASWNEDINNSTGNTKDKSSGSSESSSSGESSGKTKHTLTKIGNQGVNTYAHDLKEFRELFLNIDQMIINDKRLSDLFMNVY